MIDRYKYTKQEMKRYNTAVISDFDYQETDYYIFSREGDRLDALAFQFYQDPSLWWVIANANNIGKGSFAISPGLQIRIPYPIVDDVTDKLEQSEQNR
jgi:hypothetical protein